MDCMVDLSQDVPVSTGPIVQKLSHKKQRRGFPQMLMIKKTGDPACSTNAQFFNEGVFPR